MNKYSALEYLKVKVRERCGRLPQSFGSMSEWEEYKRRFLSNLAELLPISNHESAGKGELITRNSLSEDLLLENIAVTFDEGFYVSSHIYRPVDSEGKLSVVLVCPGYGQPKNAEDIAGIGMSLARSGFAAVTLDYTGTGEAADRPDHHTNINNIAAAASLLGINDVGLRVMSNLAVLKYLKTLEYIDSERIGITGICQGSIVLWYTAALSDDITAIAPVCGTTNYEAEVLEYSSRQGGWTGISPFVFNLLEHGDVQHLYGCFAPRPLLAQNNIIDRHWPQSGFEKVKRFTERIYSLYDAGDKLNFCIENEPHAFSGAFVANLTSFFTRHL